MSGNNLKTIRPEQVWILKYFPLRWRSAIISSKDLRCKWGKIKIGAWTLVKSRVVQWWSCWSLSNFQNFQIFKSWVCYKVWRFRSEPKNLSCWVFEGRKAWGASWIEWKWSLSKWVEDWYWIQVWLELGWEVLKFRSLKGWKRRRLNFSIWTNQTTYSLIQRFLEQV